MGNNCSCTPYIGGTFSAVMGYVTFTFSFVFYTVFSPVAMAAGLVLLALGVSILLVRKIRRECAEIFHDRSTSRPTFPRPTPATTQSNLTGATQYTVSAGITSITEPTTDIFFGRCGNSMDEQRGICTLPCVERLCCKRKTEPEWARRGFQCRRPKGISIWDAGWHGPYIIDDYVAERPKETVDFFNQVQCCTMTIPDCGDDWRTFGNIPESTLRPLVLVSCCTTLVLVVFAIALVIGWIASYLKRNLSHLQVVYRLWVVVLSVNVFTVLIRIVAYCVRQQSDQQEETALIIADIVLLLAFIWVIIKIKITIKKWKRAVREYKLDRTSEKILAMLNRRRSTRRDSVYQEPQEN